MRVSALNLLSARSVKALLDGRHSDGGGLYLQVKGNNRSWIFRYTMGGKKRVLGLGSINSVSLSAARTKAAANREIIADGGDPKVVRLEAKASVAPVERKALTFRAAMDEYLLGHLKTLSNPKARQQWTNTLETYAASLMRMEVSAITAADVHDCLQPIWLSKMETASRVRQRIEAVIAFADAKEDRERRNPADRKGKLAYLLPKQTKVKVVKHHRAVAIADAADAFAALWARRDNGMGYRAVVAVILSGLRSGEIRHLRWSDILDDVIVIPADRMKARRGHTIPLTPLLEKWLSAQPRFTGTDLVFPGTSGKAISDMTMAKAMQRTGIDATVHGWRSVFRDWAGQQGWQRELPEHQLAHSVGNAVERAYARDTLVEQRRPMMVAWEDFVSRRVNDV